MIDDVDELLRRPGQGEAHYVLPDDRDAPQVSSRRQNPPELERTFRSGNEQQFPAIGRPRNLSYLMSRTRRHASSFATQKGLYEEVPHDHGRCGA